MEILKTNLDGCFLIKPQVFIDERGHFFESFNSEAFNQAAGRVVNFVQDNQSLSQRGVLRGLHAQKGECAQAKLVRVIKGDVLDVAVDARPGSPTFGQHYKIQLSDKNKLQLFIPRGFLHGFLVLSDVAEFFYKCDNFYNKPAEWGVRFDDPDIGIDWGSSSEKFIVSTKDSALSSLVLATGLSYVG